MSGPSRDRGTDDVSGSSPMPREVASDTSSAASRRAEAAAQMVEHVGPDGSVLEVVTRSEMRARSLRHRSVYVAIVDDQRLLVHKRADWKDVFPGAWDLAFGGVCDVGEAWADAAERELWEEAGVTGDLVDRGPVSFEADDVALVGRLYVCAHAGPFAFNDGEVTATRWVPIDALADFVQAHDVPDDSAAIVTPTALGIGDSATTDRRSRPIDKE